MKTAKYNIGQQYIARGKRKDICTIVDIYKTYNSANELVKIGYVAEHEFLGETIKEYDVPQATIARGLIE